VAYQVELSRRAEEDIAGVLRWFQEQGASAAGTRWLSRLTNRIDTLQQRPDRCPFASEALDLHRGVRELLVGRKRGASSCVAFRSRSAVAS
jgi:hypothetical protein